MLCVKQTVRTGIAATLFLAGLTAGAHGQDVGSGTAFGPPGEDAIEIHGRVLCTACSLDEFRHTQPQESDLYQLSYNGGQLVMQIDKVSTARRWQHVVTTPRVWVRGEPGLLQKLTAEANLFKELEIQGILSNTRTLDITSLTRGG
jgi:hypothetical protein